MGAPAAPPTAVNGASPRLAWTAWQGAASREITDDPYGDVFLSRTVGSRSGRSSSSSRTPYGESPRNAFPEISNINDMVSSATLEPYSWHPAGF
jgi:hypothetical protein